MALAFPDVYEVGMSYLGQKILYDTINTCDAYYAERSFAPTLDVADVLRSHHVPLATLESDTALDDLDAVLFSLTHELCYTNVLYMLDLGHIPLQAKARGPEHPVIIAGGGCTFNAEPLASFIDVMVLGDGEEIVPEILAVLARAKTTRPDRNALFQELSRLPGVYIPSFFQKDASEQLVPRGKDILPPEKRVVLDMNQASFPTRQIVPFGKPVHDRFSVEIARGCTRGCRFCQAGIIYRPVRERRVEELAAIIHQGLAETGSEELSFLSLSTGDFSALEQLFLSSYQRCQAEQISISLPSLRVGSVSQELMALMSRIRHTGLTLAPEAGTQRLRDVINKGVTEAELLDHTRTAFELGWQQVKLYFMIGLPTEQPEDLDGILDLCLKVIGTAGPKAKRLQVTAAISSFVPKPHTPFQWARQISMAEIEERVGYLRSIFKTHRRLKLKWHHSHMTFLEGVFSRGDRNLAPAIENAYKKGALFTSWSDHLNLDLWQEAFFETGIEPEKYLAERNLDAPLPWDHLNSGVSKKFLRTELQRALNGRITPDCRYEACRDCGICNMDGRKSLLQQGQDKEIRPVVNHVVRDQEHSQSILTPRRSMAELQNRKQRFRLWYSKIGPAIYLSQLELQRIFERAFRRVDLPLAFSNGYRPAPLVSFSRALPVGVGSVCEWMDFFVCRVLDTTGIGEQLSSELPSGMRVIGLDELPCQRNAPVALRERFTLHFVNPEKMLAFKEKLEIFLQLKTLVVPKMTKKGEPGEIEIRSLVEGVARDQDGLSIDFDWQNIYVSPIFVLQGIDPDFSLLHTKVVKTKQFFESNNKKGRNPEVSP